MFFKCFTHIHYVPSLALPLPQGPRGARDLKCTIDVPLVPKMLHIKFEKNWISGYQEVKNVQLLTHFIYDHFRHFGPTPQYQIPYP